MNDEEGGPDASGAVSTAIVAEFNALRAEITDLERHEKLSLQLALTLLVALVAATVAISGGATLNRLESVGIAPPILAAVAAIFFLIACHALHAELRIALAARYIHGELRTQFHDLTGVWVWCWEDYLHRQRQRENPAGFDDRLIRILDWMRWLVYVIPITGCLLAFGANPSLRTVPAWQFSFGMICLALVATLGLVAACKPGFTILR